MLTTVDDALSILRKIRIIDLVNHGPRACREMTAFQLPERNWRRHNRTPHHTFGTGYGELPEGSYRYNMAKHASQSQVRGTVQLGDVVAKAFASGSQLRQGNRDGE